MVRVLFTALDKVYVEAQEGEYNWSPYLYFEGTPFTGIAFEMWDNKQLRYEYTCIEGRKIGRFCTYYENGSKESEGNYDCIAHRLVHSVYNDDNGKLVGNWGWLGGNERHGICKEYYENGTLFTICNYYAGLKVGLEKTFFPNGQLKSQQDWHIDENGSQYIEGAFKEYYENGNLKKEGHYKEDKLHGICREYLENGELEFEENWHFGVLV